MADPGFDSLVRLYQGKDRVLLVTCDWCFAVVCAHDITGHTEWHRSLEDTRMKAQYADLRLNQSRR